MAEQVCLRCGTPYEDGATVCFTCGAPIGEIETPTQPVRAPKRTAPETIELPAITPNSGAAHGADGKRAATSAGQVAIASRPGSAGAPSAGRLSGRSGRGALIQPRKRTRWPAILLVSAVVVLFIGAAVIEVRGLLAGPPIPKAQVYHDPQGRFSFTRPTLWTVTPESDGALLTDSSGTDSAQISVAPAPTAIPGKKTTPDAQAADGLAAQLGLPAQATQPPQTIAGAIWQQREGQVIGSDGTAREIDLLVTIHNGLLYSIEFSSPTSSFESINNLVYQPLLASFSFK